MWIKILATFFIFSHSILMDINIVLLSSDAKLPARNTSTDAGYDLYAVEEYILQPWERHIFLTNISMSIPAWWYGRIAPRSGLAAKHGIDVLGGVIDAWYRGDIGVILMNFGLEQFHVLKHMKIAQIIFERYEDVNFVRVESLEESDRGGKWWWSSGV